ncbi:MAG: nucleotidyl transferase AbiEii/AbiGii toxin family protein [Solirubrobacteraceae bacterium]
MSDILNASRADELLTALAEQLAAAGERYELVVVGGSALLALGLIDRPTRDVDVVALREAGVLTKAEPFPQALVAARDRVARDFGLPEDWLNAGPADLIDFGLPAGFLDRVETRTFGQALTVHFASRLDQIHFKLYALVDQGAGKHGQDLRALEPTRDELVQAARWSRTHDPSDGYRQMLEQALEYLGVHGADLGA